MEDRKDTSTNKKGTFLDIAAPRDQLMYKVLNNVLALLGLGNMDYWGIPYNKTLNRFYKIHGLLTYSAPICVISQILYIYVHYADLSVYVLGVIFSVMPINVTICLKILSTKTANYKSLMCDFMDKMHLYNKYLEEPHNEFIKSKVKQTEKLTRFAAYFLSMCLLTDWTAWTMIPFIDYLRNQELVERRERKLETCVYLYMPFDYSYDIHNWLIVHCFGSYMNIGGISIVVTFDTLCFLFIFNLIGHLQILKYKMETVCTNRKLTQREISKKLVEIIEYHAYITRCFDDVQDTFGLNITANYMQNLFVDSILLYQLMVGVNEDKAHFILFGLMFLGYMGGLMFMSFVLEEIRRQSENFSDLIYNLAWEDMSKKNQTTVLMVLGKMQPPLIFKGAGGLNTGVRPMISIVKSTFSYYVMLNNRNGG